MDDLISQFEDVSCDENGNYEALVRAIGETTLWLEGSGSWDKLREHLAAIAGRYRMYLDLDPEGYCGEWGLVCFMIEEFLADLEATMMSAEVLLGKSLDIDRHIKALVDGF